MMSAPAIASNPATQGNGARASDRLDEQSSVLLALDGDAAGSAAARVAADFERAKGSRIRVLTVERLIPLPTAAPSPAMASAVGEWPVLPHQRRLHLRGQIDSAVGRRTDWPIAVEIGVPAQIIAREARRSEADLIVLGLQPHTTLDRLMNRATALAVVRQATVPVLAVTPTLRRAPRRIVVAVDFSRASLRAARVALGMIADGGTLLLTHVMPNFASTSEATEGWGIVYSQGIAAAFARLQEELKAPPQVRVETAFLEGPVVDALLSFAGAAQADLIAVGTHRHTFMDRLIVGSVTEMLIRSARRSLLISPPGDVARRTRSV